MKKFFTAKFLIILFLLALGWCPIFVSAKDTYPKLANYYLAFFKQADYDQLAKWDLLVIQAEMTQYNPQFFDLYRQRKPDGKLLPYTYPAFFFEEANPSNYNGLPLRKYVLDKIEQNNWWLKNGNGGPVYVWPQLRAVNLANSSWQDFMASYITEKLDMNKWDGVMFDTVDAEIQHYSKQGVDLNNDGRAESTASANQIWRDNMAQLFYKTRQAVGPNKTIIINGNSTDSYQPNINGRIFEMFPTPWEGNGSWQATMYQYLRRLPPRNKQPNIYIINGSTNNNGRSNDYRKVRFGLTSALLGDGYFSFDYGTMSHQQLWWYDEYDVALGRAESTYYNLLAPTDDYVRAGLWRRDFENGVAIVNSTDKTQLYIFKHEQFEKILGSQDRNINDGSKVNYVRLGANDGIIMRRVKQDIVGSVFSNGSFMRVFNNEGAQQGNGFFAYRGDVQPNALVLLDDLNNDGKRDRLADQGGNLVLYLADRPALRIYPYGDKFKGKLSFAVYDFNKDGNKEIVVAPLSSGGPHVKIFNLSGKALSSGFFVFDKNFRGGVNLAAGDINNDGQGEIIAGAGKGMPSTVKILTDKGNMLSSFLAYGKNFRGGVNVAVGDVTNSGKNVLVTGAASSGPHVKIFDDIGVMSNEFMAYDPKSGAGITVMISDVNGDGRQEIIAGTTNF